MASSRNKPEIWLGRSLIKIDSEWGISRIRLQKPYCFGIGNCRVSEELNRTFPGFYDKSKCFFLRSKYCAAFLFPLRIKKSGSLKSRFWTFFLSLILPGRLFPVYRLAVL
ncbi:MAG TPA: hypothetical protein VFC34_12770, partial [Puia sp.]|nr:hypothetical protein [Puia sp.]